MNILAVWYGLFGIQYRLIRIFCTQTLPLLHPSVLPVFTPIQEIRKIGHKLRIKWHTSGFL